jgi:capsular exopolysaccharide synthesis family protein
MSKFFDATQRAIGVETDPDIGLKERLKRIDSTHQVQQAIEVENEDSLIPPRTWQGDLPDQDDVLGDEDGVLDEAFEILPSGAEAEASVDRASTTAYSRTGSRAEEHVEDDVKPPPSSVATSSKLLEEQSHPAFERIVHRLHAFRGTPRQSVILFSSAVQGEGTSTIARKTAKTLGRQRAERVLLVDANLRAPVQHAEFNTERTIGLSDVILGSISLTTAVKPDVSSGLSLLTAGDPVESPSRVLTQSVLQGLVMALTSLFDWVIIDGPPLTASPEAASLASVSGGAVLVVRAERTRQEVVEESKRVLGASEVDLIGAVLNRRKYHIPDFIYRRL